MSPKRCTSNSSLIRVESNCLDKRGIKMLYFINMTRETKTCYLCLLFEILNVLKYSFIFGGE